MYVADACFMAILISYFVCIHTAVYLQCVAIVYVCWHVAVCCNVLDSEA